MLCQCQGSSEAAISIQNSSPLPRQAPGPWGVESTTPSLGLMLAKESPARPSAIASASNRSARRPRRDRRRVLRLQDNPPVGPANVLEREKYLLPASQGAACHPVGRIGTASGGRGVLRVASALNCLSAACSRVRSCSRSATSAACLSVRGGHGTSPAPSMIA
jgi:hypothetical protein